MPHLTLDSQQTISNVQKQFNEIFPFLKIEFFTEPHAAGQLSTRNKMISSSVKLGEVKSKVAGSRIEINGEDTVSKFEKQFEDKNGLYVQVFRKSGNIWLETSATDNWTLEQQNEEGRSLQQHFKKDIEDLTDRDIY